MTDRAKRAAAVLQQFGWEIDDFGNTPCVACGYVIRVELRYCAQCGKRRESPASENAIAELEAAIAAANGEAP